MDCIHGPLLDVFKYLCDIDLLNVRCVCSNYKNVVNILFRTHMSIEMFLYACYYGHVELVKLGANRLTFNIIIELTLKNINTYKLLVRYINFTKIYNFSLYDVNIKFYADKNNSIIWDTFYCTDFRCDILRYLICNELYDHLDISLKYYNKKEYKLDSYLLKSRLKIVCEIFKKHKIILIIPK